MNFGRRASVNSHMPAPKSRKRVIFVTSLVVLAAAGLVGFARLRGASVDIDPSKLATVERGTMVRSVVATTRVEPRGTSDTS